MALAASWATGPATRGFFLQEPKARQIQSTAPNKRIDRRFDNIRSRFFAFGQRIPVQTAGRAPDEKVASALSIETIYPLHLDGAHQHLIVNRPHLRRIVGTLSLASTRDLMRAEAAFVEPMPSAAGARRLESFLILPKDPVRLSPRLRAPSGEVLGRCESSASVS